MRATRAVRALSLLIVGGHAFATEIPQAFNDTIRPLIAAAEQE